MVWYWFCPKTIRWCWWFEWLAVGAPLKQLLGQVGGLCWRDWRGPSQECPRSGGGDTKVKLGDFLNDFFDVNSWDASSKQMQTVDISGWSNWLPEVTKPMDLYGSIWIYMVVSSNGGPLLTTGFPYDQELGWYLSPAPEKPQFRVLWVQVLHAMEI